VRFGLADGTGFSDHDLWFWPADKTSDNVILKHQQFVCENLVRKHAKRIQGKVVAQTRNVSYTTSKKKFIFLIVLRLSW